MEPINETTARQLLARYLLGETTLSEEKQLSNYLCTAALPDDLLPCRALFRFFRDEAAVTPPESASTRSLRTRPRYLRLFAPLAAAAAGILLFLSLYHPAHSDFVCYQDGRRINDRQEAMLLAQQQWEQVSAQIEKATAMAEKLDQMKNYTQTISKYIPK